ncbi:kinase-like domain-containing protein [Aspergillus venezuelensis]
MSTANPPPPFTSLLSTPSTFTNVTPIYQGAEAHLYKTTFLSPTTPCALKIRPSKPYRHPILDRRLTRARILQEARCLQKLVRKGVSVPALLGLDWEFSSKFGSGLGSEGQAEAAKGGSWLVMEWIEGEVVRVIFERWEAYIKAFEKANEPIPGKDEEESKVGDLMRRIGGAVGGLHRAGVIHGDLTTSNLMLRPEDSSRTANGTETTERVSPGMEGEVVLIDFGLASQSVADEDRAVDLYVLERAFGSSHPRTERFFEEVLVGYKESYKGAVSTLKRLEDVRMRGRKRSMIG